MRKSLTHVPKTAFHNTPPPPLAFTLFLSFLWCYLSPGGGSDKSWAFTIIAVSLFLVSPLQKEALLTTIDRSTYLWSELLAWSCRVKSDLLSLPHPPPALVGSVWCCGRVENILVLVALMLVEFWCVWEEHSFLVVPLDSHTLPWPLLSLIHLNRITFKWHNSTYNFSLK